MGSEFFEILSHKGRAKAAIRKLNMKQLEELKEVIDEQIEETMIAEQQKLQLESKQIDAIEAIRKIAMEANLPVPEFQALPVMKRKRTRMTQIEDKFQVTDIHGFQRNWSGFGHAPVQIKQAFQEGYSKEKLLKENNVILKVAFTDTTKCTKLTPKGTNETSPVAAKKKSGK